jgi:hypothetical protein
MHLGYEKLNAWLVGEAEGTARKVITSPREDKSDAIFVCSYSRLEGWLFSDKIPSG